MIMSRHYLQTSIVVKGLHSQMSTGVFVDYIQYQIQIGVCIMSGLFDSKCVVLVCGKIGVCCHIVRLCQLWWQND